MMEKTKKNIPELRFSDYNNQWKEIKLGDIISNLESGVSVNSIDETINNISEFGILKTSCISQGNFNPFENKRILDNEVSRARLNPVKDSILISRMNTLQLVGESGYVTVDYSNLFIPDRLWMVTSDSNKVNSRFLSIILSSSKLMAQISNIATGTSGSMKNISQPNFLNLQVVIPNIFEQQKVSSFFITIDDKLHTLKKKKTLLEQYKKGIMQKIFSKEFRFKDDNGEAFPKWEKKKFGMVSEIIMGQSPDSNSYNSEGNGIYLIQGNADLSNKKSNPRNWTTEPTKVCEIGDLIFTVRAPVGAIAKSIHNACIGRGVCAIKNKSNSNIEYLYQFLINYEPKWVRLEQGSTFTAVSGADIKSIEIPLPCLEEQSKIANFLSAIDEKINLCTTQIEKTEQYKKGLLQKMFV